jgi:hypothetical protein
VDSGLPSLVNDTATLLTIITAVPVIGGWLLWLLGGRSQRASPPPPEQMRPHQGTTILGSLKTWFVDVTINPKVDLSHDVGPVTLFTVIWLGVAGFSLFFEGTGLAKVLHGIIRLLLPVLGIIITILWGRVFLKRAYLNRQ